MFKRRVCSAQRRKMAEQTQFRLVHFPHRSIVVHRRDLTSKCSLHSHGTSATSHLRIATAKFGSIDPTLPLQFVELD